MHGVAQAVAAFARLFYGIFGVGICRFVINTITRAQLPIQVTVPTAFYALAYAFVINCIKPVTHRFDGADAAVKDHQLLSPQCFGGVLGGIFPKSQPGYFIDDPVEFWVWQWKVESIAEIRGKPIDEPTVGRFDLLDDFLIGINIKVARG